MKFVDKSTHFNSTNKYFSSIINCHSTQLIITSAFVAGAATSMISRKYTRYFTGGGGGFSFKIFALTGMSVCAIGFGIKSFVGIGINK